MNDKFFPELARRLKREGIAAGPVEKDCLPVLLDGQEVMVVEPWSTILLKVRRTNSSEVDRVYDTVIQVSAQVYEYTEAMASSPRLEAAGLDEDFRLLAEYNGVVLAGQELERDWGYKFVTWRRSGDGSGVTHGNYYHNDYEGAKLDFSCRSGLAAPDRQFSDEQLTEVYRCIHETLDNGYPITREREKLLTTAMEQIELSVGPPQSRPSGFVGRGGARERTQFSPQAETELSGLCPDEDERVEQSNLRELEADSGPVWGMTP